MGNAVEDYQGKDLDAIWVGERVTVTYGIDEKEIRGRVLSNVNGIIAVGGVKIPYSDVSDIR